MQPTTLFALLLGVSASLVAATPAAEAEASFFDGLKDFGNDVKDFGKSLWDQASGKNKLAEGQAFCNSGWGGSGACDAAGYWTFCCKEQRGGAYVNKMTPAGFDDGGKGLDPQPCDGDGIIMCSK
ncbi:hypothetical protein Slin14017_G114410 [Septoria linicola]|nr:hypothetical protein Slin14017_G114410 [Septoria linicola]